MSISLVVATIGRIEPLRCLLASLRKQSLREFEILLADQNPPGYLAGLIAEFSDLPLRVTRIAPCGVSAARNVIMPFITGNIVGFPDDDCYYEPDTLQKVSRFFVEHPDAGGVLANWRPPHEEFIIKSNNDVINRYSSFVRGETHVQFYRRCVVEKVGGFDPVLGPGTGLPYGCGEDTDYLLRVIDAGIEVRREMSIHTRHPGPDLKSFDPHKIYNYGIGRMFLLKKHHFNLGFKLITVAFPLMKLPFEGLKASRYRMAMFRGRLYGLLSNFRNNL